MLAIYINQKMFENEQKVPLKEHHVYPNRSAENIHDLKFAYTLQ